VQVDIDSHVLDLLIAILEQIRLIPGGIVAQQRHSQEILNRPFVEDDPANRERVPVFVLAAWRQVARLVDGNRQLQVLVVVPELHEQSAAGDQDRLEHVGDHWHLQGLYAHVVGVGGGAGREAGVLVVGRGGKQREDGKVAALACA